MSEVNVRLLYRQILKSLKYYPSIKRDKIIESVKIEFRANRNLEGDKLITALRNGVMEQKRLETWMKTRDRNDPSKMVPGDDFTVQL